MLNMPFSWPTPAEAEGCLGGGQGFHVEKVWWQSSVTSCWPLHGRNGCLSHARRKLDTLLSGNSTLRITETPMSGRLGGKESLWLIMTRFINTASILIDPKGCICRMSSLGICRDYVSSRTCSTIHPAGHDRCFLPVLWWVEVGYSFHVWILRILGKLKLDPCSLYKGAFPFLGERWELSNNFQAVYKRPPAGREGLLLSTASEAGRRGKSFGAGMKDVGWLDVPTAKADKYWNVCHGLFLQGS